MTIESVEKLREWAKRFGPMGSHDPLMFADEIEREVVEVEAFCKRVEKAANNREELDVFGVTYMPLPIDADGVPIHVGDMLEYDYGDISGKHTVIALIYDGSRMMDFDGGIWDFEFDDDVDGNDTRVVNCMSDFYSCNRHVKPRTLEDVLRDVMQFGHDDNTVGEHADAVVNKYADEIRELMEVRDD